MKNLLNEELALTWGTHYVEDDPIQRVVNGKHAYIEMLFCKAGREDEEHESIFRASCSLKSHVGTMEEKDFWQVDNYTVVGVDDYHKDIKDAMSEVVCEYLDEYYR